MIPYIICYFAAGLLLAIGVLVNSELAYKKRLMKAFLIVLLWPLIALAAPEAFLSHDSDVPEAADTLQNSLKKILNSP